MCGISAHDFHWKYFTSSRFGNLTTNYSERMNSINFLKKFPKMITKRSLIVLRLLTLIECSQLHHQFELITFKKQQLVRYWRHCEIQIISQLRTCYCLVNQFFSLNVYGPLLLARSQLLSELYAITKQQVTVDNL